MAVATAACMRPTGPPRLPLRAAAAMAADAGLRTGAASRLAGGLAGGLAAARADGTGGLTAWDSATSSSLKNATLSFMVSDWCSSVLAEAAFSSTRAEFCCVISSIWVSALLI
jgi:hypothetical protein